MIMILSINVLKMGSAGSLNEERIKAEGMEVKAKKESIS